MGNMRVIDGLLGEFDEAVDEVVNLHQLNVIPKSNRRLLWRNVLTGARISYNIVRADKTWRDDSI